MNPHYPCRPRYPRFPRHPRRFLVTLSLLAMGLVGLIGPAAPARADETPEGAPDDGKPKAKAEASAEVGLKPGAKEKPYGFRGLEIYKLDGKIQSLTVADIDADGRRDLLIANNDRAKIEVLLRRKEPIAFRSKKGEKLPNDLVDDRFFERKEILTEKRVTSIAAGDFNGDGNVDVAYYGSPAELVVAYGDGKGGFAETATVAIDDGGGDRDALAAGDINGDGRHDLVLVAKQYTALIYQTDKGRLAEPAKVPHGVKGVRQVALADLDGDGRLDLVHLAPTLPRSVRVRFQQTDGSLGAELEFEVSPWRNARLQDIDPAPGAEVLVVQRTSGVFRSLRMASKEAPAGLGTMESHAFEETRGGKPRALAVGDVNGDGRADVVVTEPGVAQVAVYLQDATGALQGRRLFPSLSNTEAVRVADLDGDGRAEVVVLSAEERAVGIAAWTAEGRLPFPTLLATPGIPKALGAGDLNGDGRTDLVVVTEEDKKRAAHLWLQPEAGTAGGIAALPAPTATLALGDLKAAPEDVLVMDIDQDGSNDLLLFNKYEPMKILRATGKPMGDDAYATPAGDYRSGLVNKLDSGNVNPADLDGDGKAELLVATKNYARALMLDTGKGAGLTVRDQANGATPRSQIKGAAALDLDGDGKNEVALYDRDDKVVTILARDPAGVFAVRTNLPVGDLDFLAMHVADLNGDQRPDLLLFGRDRFGILYAQGADRQLQPAHSVESSARDAFFTEFAVGDLNGDGQPDVAMIDAGNKAIQILSYGAKGGFAEQIRWRVYEEKMHQQRRGTGGAREIVIADLDGNGLNDIAILIHDRLIVYPQ